MYLGNFSNNPAGLATTSTVSSVTTSGKNRVGVVVVGSDRGSYQCTGVTWGGAAMTLIKRQAYGVQEVSLWYIVNPPTSSSNVVASVSGSSIVPVEVYVYNDIDQLAPIDASTNATSTGTSAVTNITTVSNNAFLVYGIGAVGQIATPTAGMTKIENLGQGNQGLAPCYGGPITPAGLQSNVGGTLGGSAAWGLVMASLKPALSLNASFLQHFV